MVPSWMYCTVLSLDDSTLVSIVLLLCVIDLPLHPLVGCLSKSLLSHSFLLQDSLQRCKITHHLSDYLPVITMPPWMYGPDLLLEVVDVVGEGPTHIRYPKDVPQNRILLLSW